MSGDANAEPRRWPAGWRAPAPAEAAALESELRRELGAGHVLADRKSRVIARRDDRDDILIELPDEPGRVAVVHLTYRGTREPNPIWPETRFHESIVAWRKAEQEDPPNA